MTVRRELEKAAMKTSALLDLDPDDASRVVTAILDKLIDRMTSVGFTASSRLGELNADGLRRIRDGML